jgi:hypothetical protein
LQPAQLKQRRTSLNESRGIRQASERRRLSPSSLEGGQPLLPGANDLRKNLLQVAWKRQILEISRTEFEAEVYRGSGSSLKQLRADCRATLEQVVYGARGNDRAQ